MSRALLDTSGYSAFMRGDTSVKEMLQTVDAIYLNAVVLGELRAGFLRGRMRQKRSPTAAVHGFFPRLGRIC